MEQLIEKLAQSNLTWSVAVVIIAIVLRPVMLAGLEIVKESIKSRRELERDRVEAEKEQTRMLGLLKDELMNSRGINTQLITSVNAIPATLEAMQRQNGAIHEDVKIVPSEVWRMGDTRLETMRKRLEDRMSELQRTILDQLDPGAINAREAIQIEFATMATRLDDIANTVKKLTPTKTPPVTGAMTDLSEETHP